MNKPSYKKFPLISLLAWALPGASALAAVTPTLITGQSTLNQVGISAADLPTLLGTVFNLGIAVAVVLALIMIIFGGIEMMTSDSWQKHDDGKGKIKDALLGLGLALISWLLLYIINPSLVTFCGNILVGKSCS